VSRLACAMAFYAAYHQDKRNRLTHAFGVPIIVFSLMVPLSLIDLSGVWPGLNLATALTAALLGYYLYLDIGLGLVLTAAAVGMLWLACLASFLSPLALTGLSAGFFIFGWALQLLGHRFEGNKPALTASFTQIFMAPLFLMAEAFFALGLRRQTQRAVEERVATLAPPPS
jgi:uncharacterized membrane protein YGL010W